MNKLRKTELYILDHLLSEHIANGNYFGNREQHYKMCKELLDKIEEAIQSLKDK